MSLDPERKGPAPGEAERRAQEERLLEVWAAPKSWRYWSAVNNTEVGLWYTVTTFVFFLAAGVLALLMRAQLAVPNHDFLSQEAYNQVFTMHGTVMMFLVRRADPRGGRDLLPAADAGRARPAVSPPLRLRLLVLRDRRRHRLRQRSSSSPRRPAAGSCIRR